MAENLTISPEDFRKYKADYLLAITEETSVIEVLNNSINGDIVKRAELILQSKGSDLTIGIGKSSNIEAIIV